MTDIVLNATAVSFIIELDDIVSNEVDFENWFVKSAVSVESFYKKVVPFNDTIITSDSLSTTLLQSKLNEIREELKMNNLNATNLSCCELMEGLCEILLFPFILFTYPYLIFKALSDKKCTCCGSSVSGTDKQYEDDGAGVIQKPARIMSDSSSEETEEEETKEQHQTTNITVDDYDDYSDYKTKPILALNNEGNEFMTKYMFREACDRYKRATKLGKDTEFWVSNMLILWYNAGCAFYERAQQSFVSEVITNRNGHPYTNYNKAIEYFKDCERWTDDSNLKKICGQMLSKVYYNLYRFDKAIECDKDMDTKRKEQIETLREDARHSYLEILENMRQYLVRKAYAKSAKKDNASSLEKIKEMIQKGNNTEAKEEDDKIFKDLNAVINDTNDKLFRDNDVLKGKYFYIRSDYYSMMGNDEESKKDAERAKECSDLFAYKLFELSETPSSELCQGIINEFTKQIEFDAHQPYYYYVRGRACYQLYTKNTDNVAYGQQALDDFKRAAELERSNPTFWMRYGLCQFALNDRENALKSFGTAIRSDSMKGFGEIYLEYTKASFWSAYYRAVKDNADYSQMKFEQWDILMDALMDSERSILQKIKLEQYSNENNIIEIGRFEALLEERIAKDPSVYEQLLGNWETLQTRSKYFNEGEWYPGFIRFKQYIIRYFFGYIKGFTTQMYDHMRDNEAFGVDQETGALPEKAFKIIISWLPTSLRTLMESENMSFQQVCGDDGMVDFDEFTALIDHFTEKLETKYSKHS